MNSDNCLKQFDDRDYIYPNPSERKMDWCHCNIQKAFWHEVSDHQYMIDHPDVRTICQCRMPFIHSVAQHKEGKYEEEPRGIPIEPY